MFNFQAEALSKSCLKGTAMANGLPLDLKEFRNFPVKPDRR